MKMLREGDNMRTAIVSAFPGCGKSFIYNKYNGEKYNNDKKWKILDSDSSDYSWIKDENGNNTKERNPEFPNNYINHIKENIGKVDIIFVSSHEIVRQALKDNKIKFFLIFPENNLKDDFIQRYKKRGNDETFINFISNNWNNFINEMENESDYFCLIEHLTEENPYITMKFLDSILEENEMGNLAFLWTMGGE